MSIYKKILSKRYFDQIQDQNDEHIIKKHKVYSEEQILKQKHEFFTQHNLHQYHNTLLCYKNQYKSSILDKTFYMYKNYDINHNSSLIIYFEFLQNRGMKQVKTITDSVFCLSKYCCKIQSEPLNKVILFSRQKFIHLKYYLIDITVKKGYEIMFKIFNTLIHLHQCNITHNALCTLKVIIIEDNPFLVGFSDPKLSILDKQNEIQYLSYPPERLFNNEIGTCKGDIYSFGLLCREIILKTEVDKNQLLEDFDKKRTQKIKFNNSGYINNTIDLVNDMINFNPLKRPSNKTIYKRFKICMDLQNYE